MKQYNTESQCQELWQYPVFLLGSISLLLFITGNVFCVNREGIRVVIIFVMYVLYHFTVEADADIFYMYCIYQSSQKYDIWMGLGTKSICPIGLIRR